MEQVKINEFTEKIDSMMSKVLKGEMVTIIKEGKPIAELIPIQKKKKQWKKRVEKVSLPKGVSTRIYIEEERNLR
jgi:antitoxin (DNA-binding transcriptional repressor) of toxin-antitoxin stability system